MAHQGLLWEKEGAAVGSMAKNFPPYLIILCGEFHIGVCGGLQRCTGGG